MTGTVPVLRGGIPTPSYDAIWEANRRANALLQARRTYSAGADSSSPLNVPQRAHAIGDPVPIAFARRRDNAGGVLISPKATECRFENSLSNEVTAYYHLVLSEGRIGDIEVRDVFQRQCRVGDFQQTYGRRAGSWVPENAIVPQVGYTKPEASNFCGSPGTYEGISTMSFQVTIPSGLDVWNRQVHAFIRNGIEVYRWADGANNAPSDSFADLAYWLMVNSARIPAALIDTASIQVASRFLDANSITTNCWITRSVNYSEFVTAWGRYHLLQPVTNKGKVGLRPLLPINGDYTIKTSAVSIDYVFDDDSVIPGSVDLQYVDWASRQPFVCQVIWRQQNEADIGVVRTSEVRYDGTAPDGPYESHDLSEFCTREIHALRVGAYILSKRIRSSHSIRFRTKPGLHSSTLQQGSIIRVRLRRAAQGDTESFHDRLYEVDRIRRSIAGDVSYEATYLPVDDQLRSLVALDVMAATASGVVFPSGLTGEGCDLNSDSDTTVPADDPEDTIIPVSGSPAIDGGVGVGIDPGDFPTDDPGDDGLIEDAEFNNYIDGLTDSEFIAIINDLLDETAASLRGLSDAELAALLRALSDAELEALFDGLTAAQIRALSDAVLADVADAVSDEDLVIALNDSVRDVIKEQLDLDFDPELLQALRLKFKDAKELEDSTIQPDPQGDYEAGIYFHDATWADNVLTVRMRLLPTGKAPREDLGSLFATIASTSVVALLPDGSLADPQPGSLPSVSFTGLIAEPWDGVAEGLPVPPADRVFEGQFAVTFYEGAFPPVAENPAEQLTYRATVEFSSWNGGFTDVTFLNTLDVDFVPTVAPPEPEASVFYWDGLDLLSTGSEDIINSDVGIESTLLGQPAVARGAQGAIEGGLLQVVQNSDLTLEWFGAILVNQIGGFLIEIKTPSVISELSVTSERYFRVTVSSDEITVISALGPPSYRVDRTRPPVNTIGLVHMCIQRINGICYAHVNGQLIFSSNNFFSPLRIYFSSGTNLDNQLSIVMGQFRLSPAAIYGTGNFTPPSEAFYDSTP